MPLSVRSTNCFGSLLFFEDGPNGFVLFLPQLQAMGQLSLIIFSANACTFPARARAAREAA